MSEKYLNQLKVPASRDCTRTVVIPCDFIFWMSAALIPTSCRRSRGMNSWFWSQIELPRVSGIYLSKRQCTCSKGRLPAVRREYLGKLGIPGSADSTRMFSSSMWTSWISATSWSAIVVLSCKLGLWRRDFATFYPSFDST
jgi:hypothetical protein